VGADSDLSLAQSSLATLVRKQAEQMWIFEQEPEFSELVELLLRDWLKKQP
jgi:hypothetical protein